MRNLSRTLIAVVAALSLLFAGTAVAQDQPDMGALLPYNTQQECEANGGTWTSGWNFCVDPDKLAALNQGDEQAPVPPAPAESPPAPATQSRPGYTG